MDSAFQPQIILLREGTDTSQGKAQIISNINACQAVAETVRTTLGPRGMDKLVFDGSKTTISNDGATIMRLLDIVHPAAKTLVDISMAQVFRSCKFVFSNYLWGLIFSNIPAALIFIVI
jgi:T-complex protein 1 subunit eta